MGLVDYHCRGAVNFQQADIVVLREVAYIVAVALAYDQAFIYKAEGGAPDEASARTKAELVLEKSGTLVGVYVFHGVHTVYIGLEFSIFLVVLEVQLFLVAQVYLQLICHRETEACVLVPLIGEIVCVVVDIAFQRLMVGVEELHAEFTVAVLVSACDDDVVIVVLHLQFTAVLADILEYKAVCGQTLMLFFKGLDSG